ncbi:Permease of the drug/metabolite transporter (DMT) superfamily [Dethiosulfatibacter aminovorans DSM 17477]|uniref:Permease of the drug/metabolite transporter (DMT) superfamily n=1 Tax=Dethiosulfatibacter aminovorans DSM 17477 TaxID=1121476 RepID=A0A1M6IC80_9FIRM|nr:DMT family transporter [Dethiosulfatibacter aminovorans]SHJ32035.1 Permease of the drug/metabolite transporter (DMT) superfamily [Dethiosulfatibacter aminovorans DSM 17477]
MINIRDAYAKYIIVLAPIAWGLNPSFMKIAYKYVNPPMMNFIRLMMAFVFFLLFLRTTNRLRQENLWKVAMDTKLLMFIFVIFQVCYSIGISMVTASITGIIFGMLPVTVLVINLVTGDEKVRGKTVVSVIMSIVGVVIIVMSGKSTGGSISFIGAALVLMAQISYGIFTVESKKKVRYHNPVVMTTVATIPSAIVFLVLSFRDLASFDYGTIPMEGWMGMVFAGVVGMGIANAIWMWGAGKIGSTRLSLYNNLNPVAALIGAFVMLGERLSPWQYFGVLVIFSAILLSQYRPKGERDNVTEI